LLDLAISHLRSDHQRSVVVIGNQIGLLDPCGTTGIQSGRGKVGMVASRYKCNRFGGRGGGRVDRNSRQAELILSWRPASECGAQPHRALVIVAIYFLPFLAIAVIAKRWMTRNGVELSDVQAEGDPNRKKRPRFLLGIWRDEGRE
jgi:hypothetical protein